MLTFIKKLLHNIFLKKYGFGWLYRDFFTHFRILLTDDCVYGEKAIGVWIQQSQGWQVNNPRGRASHVMKHIYIC
jgi:hypothetical protein